MDMQESRIEKYLEDVLSHVKFKYDHSAIRSELMGHMEERYQDFRKEGMTEENAQKAVVLSMGDAEEVGKALNQAHNPVLGMIWLIFRRVTQVLVTISLVLVIGAIVLALFGMFVEGGKKTDSAIVYEIPINQQYDLYDRRIYIKKVTYYEDKTLRVNFDEMTLPLSRDAMKRWSVGIHIYDANGEMIAGQISHRCFPGIGFYSNGYREVHEIGEDAQLLKINYHLGGKNEVVVDLREGG